MAEPITETPRKVYLGDGAYADVTTFGEVRLTTENGIEATNVIILEGIHMEELIRWWKKLTDG